MKYFLFILILLCSCKTYNIQNVTYEINTRPKLPLALGSVSTVADYQAHVSDIESIPDPKDHHEDDLYKILRSLPQPVQNVNKKGFVVIGDSNTVSGKAHAISGDSVVVAKKVDQSTETTKNDQTWMIWGIGIVVAAGLIFALIRFR